MVSPTKLSLNKELGSKLWHKQSIHKFATTVIKFLIDITVGEYKGSAIIQSETVIPWSDDML